MAKALILKCPKCSGVSFYLMLLRPDCLRTVCANIKCMYALLDLTGKQEVYARQKTMEVDQGGRTETQSGIITKIN